MFEKLVAMSAVLGLLSPFGFGDKGGRSDDDFVDRLNHQASVVLMLIFAVVVSLPLFTSFICLFAVIIFWHYYWKS